MIRKTLSTRIEEFEGKHAGLTRNAKKGCMYKVHEQLRNVNEKAYKPVLLAIGPYNDQSKVGQGFMEELKLRCLHQMLKRIGGSVETCINALKDLEEKALKCYGDHISQTSDDQFVEMMVLDGCFIIELFGYHIRDDPIFEMEWVLPRIARDLLLFENQLPFFVLEKLFTMRERKETLNRYRHLGEHTVDIDEEENGISVESSTSTAQISCTLLIDHALKFLSDFLPFEWNVDASSYNSTEKIKNLLCLVHEAHNPSLTEMVQQRLVVGFRFKNAEFENLLGLIHASICISLLDTEIDHAREREEAGLKLKNAETFEPLFGLRKAISYAREFQRSGFLVKKEEKLKHLDVLDRIEDWKTIPFGLELQKARIEFNMANKFKDKLDEIGQWRTIPYHDRIALQEAGIELKEAKKFQNLHDQNRNEDRKSIPYVLAEKFSRLLCQIKIETWKSIPYGKELREAGVKFNKAKKFKSLHDLTEIEYLNINSATELEEAGIKFKKAEKPNVFSIKFNNGLMEISPLIIEDHTETYLRNLIAYEQYYCHRPNNVNYVSNYVLFMDHLINSPKDVELLRRRGIIYNILGDDNVISTMVNKLCDYVTFPTNIYARTIMDVNMHCRRRWNAWMAKLRRDYFNSPWALVSFMGAVLLLALAITQTIFSIIH